MGIGDPEITVDCDVCGCVLTYGLTALAGRGWDDRNMERAMKRDGWVMRGDMTVCHDCAALAGEETPDPPTLITKDETPA